MAALKPFLTFDEVELKRMNFSAAHAEIADHGGAPYPA
jgi:hypothetical protein